MVVILFYFILFYLFYLFCSKSSIFYREKYLQDFLDSLAKLDMGSTKSFDKTIEDLQLKSGKE